MVDFLDPPRPSAVLVPGCSFCFAFGHPAGNVSRFAALLFPAAGNAEPLLVVSLHGTLQCKAEIGKQAISELGQVLEAILL